MIATLLMQRPDSRLYYLLYRPVSYSCVPTPHENEAGCILDFFQFVYFLRFTKYLQTFQDEGGVIGVQILPIYGHKDLKTVKQKTVSIFKSTHSPQQVFCGEQKSTDKRL